MGENVRSERLLLVFLLLCSLANFSQRIAMADVPIADWSKNPDWHYVASKNVARFNGGDAPVSADLIVNKSAVIDKTLTIESDATTIALRSGNLPYVVFQIPANPKGTTSTILMTGGDDPALFFNGDEQKREAGRWFKIFSNADSTLTIHLSGTNFANVSFETLTTPGPAAPDIPAAPLKPAPANGELLHTATAKQLSTASKLFDQAINKVCPLCGGTGKVEEEYDTGGTFRDRAGLVRHTMGTRTVNCLKCDGTGKERASDRGLIGLSCKLVKTLAALDDTDPGAMQVKTDLYNEIAKDMIGDKKTWLLLTQNGRSVLASKDPPADAAVVSVVEVKASTPMGDQRRYRVRVLGTDKQVYVDDPMLADELKSGRALMGGMVAKPVDGPDGEKMTVLHGGFLIAPPIDHDWWWWNAKD